eukprot:gene11831-biopygen15447
MCDGPSGVEYQGDAASIYVNTRRTLQCSIGWILPCLPAPRPLPQEIMQTPGIAENSENWHSSSIRPVIGHDHTRQYASIGVCPTPDVCASGTPLLLFLHGLACKIMFSGPLADRKERGGSGRPVYQTTWVQWGRRLGPLPPVPFEQPCRSPLRLLPRPLRQSLLSLSFLRDRAAAGGGRRRCASADRRCGTTSSLLQNAGRTCVHDESTILSRVPRDPCVKLHPRTFPLLLTNVLLLDVDKKLATVLKLNQTGVCPLLDF